MNRRKVNSIVFVILLVLLTFFDVSCSIFYDMSNLPEGKFVESFDSPSLNYTINIYLCDGGATTDYSIRGELVDNSNGNKKNLYWNYHESNAYVEWIDEYTVKINGHILNILSDVYDFRV